MGLRWAATEAEQRKEAPAAPANELCYTPKSLYQAHKTHTWHSPLTQPFSSLMSLQSTSLLHCRLPWMQVPSSHWNSSGWHVTAAGQKAQPFRDITIRLNMVHILIFQVQQSNACSQITIRVCIGGSQTEEPCCSQCELTSLHYPVNHAVDRKQEKLSRHQGDRSVAQELRESHWKPVWNSAALMLCTRAVLFSNR